MKKKMCKKEYLWIAFGLGAAICLFLPTIWITRVLAICVIILGILCCKN